MGIYEVSNVGKAAQVYGDGEQGPLKPLETSSLVARDAALGETGKSINKCYRFISKF